MIPSIYFDATLGASFQTLRELAVASGAAWPAGAQACYIQAEVVWQYNMEPATDGGISIPAGAVVKVTNAAELTAMRLRSIAGGSAQIQLWT